MCYLRLQERKPRRHFERDWTHAPKTLTIPNLIVNITWEGTDLYDHFNEHGNLHFDDEQDIHTSFRHYEASGYGLDLGLDFAKPLRTNHIISYEKWPSGKKVTS